VAREFWGGMPSFGRYSVFFSEIFQQKVPAGETHFWQRIGIPIALKMLTVKSNTEIREQVHEFHARINPLDAKIARLDARIERNKAELERTNTELDQKITELAKRLASHK
jgi:uncharacterized small protein (DUF1192 family)